MSDMEKILEMLAAMSQRIDTMQEDISILRTASATKEDVEALKKDMSALRAASATKEDISALRAASATKEDIAALKREMATKEDLQQAKGEMMALMEAYFEPKFDLLAEQIKLVQEKQIPMEVLEQVEDRLDVLEAAVKGHSVEIRNLKKAQ